MNKILAPSRAENIANVHVETSEMQQRVRPAVLDAGERIENARQARARLTVPKARFDRLKHSWSHLRLRRVFAENGNGGSNLDRIAERGSRTVHLDG